MKAQSFSQAQTYDDDNSMATVVELNNDPGTSITRKVRGPILLKDVWNLPSGKTIVVQFNNRNQSIGKEGRKLSSFLGIIARTPDLIPLNVDDWRVFDEEEKIKLIEFVRKKFSFPIRGEEFVKKSIGRKWKDYKCDLKTMYVTKYKTKDALMNEQAIDGIEPTRAKVYILTHTKRKDGRPLDEESSNAVDMMKEKLSNSETLEEQSHGSVAWEGDVYSQVLGNDKSGYVRGLGLGPTPSLLWGSKSSLRDVVVDGLSNEAAHKLEQEINELKELNKKQDEEMGLMRKNQEMLVSELSWMRQVMWKYAPTELRRPENNGSTTRQVPDANSGNEQAV